jgi:MYXO-CTERM domain-containing protein
MSPLSLFGSIVGLVGFFWAMPAHAACTGTCCGPNGASYTCAPCRYGETGNCRAVNTCNQTDVQNTITDSAAGTTGYTGPSSFGGDGVYIPAGTCSWSTPVSWKNQNINVLGAGPSSTTIEPSGDAFDVGVSNTGATAAAFRISAMTFAGATTGALLNINTSNPNLTSWAGFFRVDHITTSFTSTGGNQLIVYGPVWGVLDHLDVTVLTGNFLEQADFLNLEYNQVHTGDDSEFLGEYSGRILPEALGTENAIYVETSTFNCTSAGEVAAVSDSESGGQRMVFRHNTVTGSCYHYAHWSRGSEWDGHKYEIYDNSYNGGGIDGYPMRFGSGTGVIFNNTIVGYQDATIHVDETRGCGGESTNAPMEDCNGTHVWDGNAGDTSAPGWPCAGQVGTGCKLGSCTRSTMDNIPLLAWNNGAQAGCSTGGACTNSVTINVDGPQGSANTCTRSMTSYIKSTPHTAAVGAYDGAVDYCEGSTMPSMCGTYVNSYTPYAYPHPLTAGGGTGSASGSGSGSADGGTGSGAGESGLGDGGSFGTGSGNGSSSGSGGGSSRESGAEGNAPAPSSSAGCGCRSAGARPGPLALAWLSVAGLLLWRSRRRG